MGTWSRPFPGIKPVGALALSSLPALRIPGLWACPSLSPGGGKDISNLQGGSPTLSLQPGLTLLLAPLGPSFCQLQKQQILLSGYLNGTATAYLPQCQDSGDYAPVQCDLGREQCWCVDTEGMEVYGTRQRGRPTRCKSLEPRQPACPPVCAAFHM